MKLTKFLQTKKAEVGMGTLIIFIAMVLVAAVAASVLITTTGSLQGKALDTGSSTRREIGSNIQVLGVEYNATDFLIDVRLSPGSDTIDMTLGKISVAADGSTPVVSDMDTACATELKGNITDTNLNDGDIARCIITVPASASDKVQISAIPLVGIATSMTVTVPAEGSGNIFP